MKSGKIGDHQFNMDCYLVVKPHNLKEVYTSLLEIVGEQYIDIVGHTSNLTEKTGTTISIRTSYTNLNDLEKALQHFDALIEKVSKAEAGS